MNTIIQKVNPERLERDTLKEAVNILRNGGLVAFPTETVYGLGGNALEETAAKKIYEAKGRPSDNPLIIHIGEKNALEELTEQVPPKALQLAEAFWPGPLTMILKKSKKVPFSTTGGLDTVAVRMPKHKIALQLIKESGVYIAAPSANLSGRPSPTLAEHVAEDLGGRIDMIIDGGMVGLGLESTIIDVTQEIPMILRPGYITQAMLENVIGRVEVDKAILKENKELHLRPKAPGMKYKHYAPKGDLTIFQGMSKQVILAINQRAAEKIKEGFRVGIIATDETIACYPRGIVKSIGSRKDESTIARSLYSVLREFDELEVAYIYTESFESNQLGQAIMNRLLKAAGYAVVSV